MTIMPCRFLPQPVAPRPGEEHGREYFFHTKQEFEELILQDALIEYAQYVENYYGTPKAYVEKQLNAGKDVILEIEIQGALKVKEKLPETLLLFVTPPSAEELKRRLVNRGTESMDVIESRLARAAEEAKGMPKYDYILINDEIETCVDTMHKIIQSQHDTVKKPEVFYSKKSQKKLLYLREKRRRSMIHPSYTELMEAINEGAEMEDEPLVTSRYSVVLATSKRQDSSLQEKKPWFQAMVRNPFLPL